MRGKCQRGDTPKKRSHTSFSKFEYRKIQFGLDMTDDYVCDYFKPKPQCLRNS